MVPSFERPSSGASAYHSILSSPPHEQLMTQGNPCYNRTITETQSLLPSPSFIERPTTSFSYSLLPSSAPEKTLDRPATAPITLSQLMPPRRELPFPKEPVGPITNQIAQTAQIEEPNEREAIDSTDSRKAVKTIKGRAKGTAKSQTSRPSSSRTKSRPSSRQQPAKDQPLLPKPAVELTPQPFTTSETLVPSSSITKLSVTKRVITDDSPSKVNARSKSLAATEKPIPIPEQFSKDFENIAPEEYMDRLDHWVRKYQDLPAPKPMVKSTSTKKDQLAAYAAQTEDERLEALDNMICDYLDDENFVKLVEDMDKSWRRIGLGF